MIALLVRTLSAFVVLLCGLIVLSVLIFLPDLLASRGSEPEGLVGSLLFAALSLVVAAVLSLQFLGRDGRWSRGVGIVVAACSAVTAVVQLITGDWPIGLICLGVAAALLIAGFRTGPKSRKS